MEFLMDDAILLVDDEELTRDRLARTFTKKGYTVYAAANLNKALELIKKHCPKIIITELKLPDCSGLEFITMAKELNSDSQIIILTGYGSIATATKAIKLGAVDYLTKPANAEEILNVIAKENNTANHYLPNDHPVPSLARVEWEHLNRVLNDCGGNISITAKKLNVHRRTLQRKLNKYPPNK
jgi:two-component system response regulator RegA